MRCYEFWLILFHADPEKSGRKMKESLKSQRKKMTGNDISYKIIGAAIEVKAVEAVAPVDFAQLLTYLKLSGIKLRLFT